MMRYWMERAITDLQLLEQRRMAIKGLALQIQQEDADAASLSGVSFDKAPSRGGGNKQEQRMCAILKSKQELERRQATLQALVDHTELALSSLPEREREVLTEMYTKQQHRGDTVRRLENKLYISAPSIYRIRERALRQFALRMGYLIG